MTVTTEFLSSLRAAVGEGAVSVSPDDLTTYGTDWTKVYAPAPSAIVRPRTEDEVATVLRLASASRVSVVPSGGRTGLAGGAVAARGELVLSLERMNAMGEVDVLGRTLVVQAGAVTQAVHEHARASDLTWPVDFASKGSSQIGGNLATNAGGIRVIRHGLTRNWVLGLRAVLADGTILKMGRALEKNNTGIDLKQLFIGSEGTLGVITEATLKLERPSASGDVMLFAVSGLPGVIELFRKARTAPFTLNAFEFFTEACLLRVLRHRKIEFPLAMRSSAYVVLEAERHPESEAWLTSLFESGAVLDGTMAQHASQAAALWSYRESISECLSATGLPHKNDIALPIASLEAFCQALEETLPARYPGFEICLFGHIGDGNLHVNVMKPDHLSKEAFLGQTHAVDRAIFELVEAHGGSISAEHGIGLLKKDYLSFSRTPEELATMRALKAALDPLGILNPGKIL